MKTFPKKLLSLALLALIVVPILVSPKYASADQLDPDTYNKIYLAIMNAPSDVVDAGTRDSILSKLSSTHQCDSVCQIAYEKVTGGTKLDGNGVVGTNPTGQNGEDRDACGGFFSKLSIGCIIKSALMFFVQYILFPILRVLLLITGGIFNFVTELSIIDFHNFADSVFVKEGWRIIRDLTNLFFMFTLLYIAIKTVLGVGGDTKSAVIKVVLCALLINFSMAGTRLLIDASNTLTLYFYNAARGGPNGDLSARVIDALQMVENSGFASIPPEISKADTFTGPPSPEAQKALDLSQLSVMGIIFQAIGGSFFVIATIILLLVAGLLFLIRLATLIVLLVFSPWPFFNYAFHGSLTGGGKEWWDTLLNQCMLAPVFFVLFYVTLRILDGINLMPAKLGFVNDTTGRVVKFVVAFYLLTLCLTKAKEYSGEVGKSVANWGSKSISGMRDTSAAWLGRNTVGRGAAAVANTETARKWAASNKPIVGDMGRKVFGGLKGVSDAKFGGSVKGFAGQQKAEVEAKAQLGKDLKSGIGTVSWSEKEKEQNKKIQAEYIETLKKQAAGQKARGAKVGGIVGGVVGGVAGFMSGGPVGANVIGTLGTAGGGAAGGALIGRADATSEAAIKKIMEDDAKGSRKDKLKARKIQLENEIAALDQEIKHTGEAGGVTDKLRERRDKKQDSLDALEAQMAQMDGFEAAVDAAKKGEKKEEGGGSGGEKKEEKKT